MEVKTIIPKDDNGIPMFLIDPTTLAYLQVVEEELKESILQKKYMMDMLPQDLAGTIAAQAKIEMIRELLDIHQYAVEFAQAKHNGEV